MKKITLLSLVMVAVLSMAGCVSGKTNYTPPFSRQGTKNSIISPMSKNQLWQKLVSGIGDSFFVINNLDKESGFINVSYSGDPCRFVDCGQLYSSVTNARGKRDYDFPACKNYQEYEWVNRGVLGSSNRSVSLDGRANIVVQEVESGTHVKVNVRYIVRKKIQDRFQDAYGRRHPAGTLDDSISFNSNGEGTFPQNTRCVPNGQFEKAILDIVRD